MSDPASEEPTMSAQPDEKPPEEAPAEQPDQPEPESEILQPGEIDTDGAGKVIQLPTKRGSLTLSPDQVELSEQQKSALVAIGIDTANDPGIIPHVRPFIHMCQVRDLDPWAREAYLIGRGEGRYRKWTMQTGIDGYRKMAGRTGRFIRVKKTLWTGDDDDADSWVLVQDEDGDHVKRRVWFDQWPASRGNPGAAKVVIEHYDMHGEITTTSAIADWRMYAPEYQASHWEGQSGQRKKVMETNEDGSPKMVLGEMWEKGGPHMLAKCAEALADRKAFPNTMNGIYVTEEMHHLDQQERNREAITQRDRRQQARAAATTVSGTVVTEPPTVGETAAEVINDLKAQRQPEGDLVALLRAELDWQADALGHKPEKAAARHIRAAKKNLDDFTAEELLPVVTGLRAAVLTRLRDTGREEEAALYEPLVDTDQVADLDTLFVDDEPDEPDSAEDATDGPVDPTEPHTYLDNGGVCGVEGCGEEEQNRVHVHEASVSDDA